MSRLRSLAGRFPRRTLWALVFAFAFQCVVFSGSRIFTTAWRHWDMTTALDRAVPFWPWTVLIYVAAYVFWAANYNLAMFQGEDRAWRFLAADILGKAVCLVFFLGLPTANVRPEMPEGGALWLDAEHHLRPGQAGQPVPLHPLPGQLAVLGCRPGAEERPGGLQGLLPGHGPGHRGVHPDHPAARDRGRGGGLCPGGDLLAAGRPDGPRGEVPPDMGGATAAVKEARRR